MADVSSKNFDEYLKEKIKKRLMPTIKQTTNDFFEVASEKLTTAYNETIADFYNSYSPSFYERKGKNNSGGLYDLLEIKTDKEKNTFTIGFDPSRLVSRTGYSGEDGLYNLVFRLGYHGGARFGDKYLIPYRVPAKKYDGANRPWDDPLIGKKGQLFYAYWKAANRASVSPLNDFKEKFKDYEKNEAENDFYELWKRNFKNM
jgi:hypothetical protein